MHRLNHKPVHENSEEKTNKTKKKKKKKGKALSLDLEPGAEKLADTGKEKRLGLGKESKDRKEKYRAGEEPKKYPEHSILFIFEAVGTLLKYIWDVFMITLNILKPFLALYLVVVFVPLPLELKKAELAVTDLKTTVRYSRLDSTELLVEHLQEFQRTAKQVGRQIQYLQAKATTGMDKFVIHNSYLLKYLDGIDGSLYSSWMDFLVPSLFGPSRDEIQDMYRTSMETARTDVRDLILLAQETLGGLDQLDSILNGVYEITTREKNLQLVQKDELLAELWSILGGNKIQRKFFEENLSLLQQLDTQRHLAMSQVQAILMKLSELQADLEVLKEQVTHPLIEDIPLRVHIQTIENLLARVRNQQLIPTTATSADLPDGSTSIKLISP
ncbi:hypothetical protein K493DRAFT_410544 [Basidiobolus meristosporus CBS 931.73]|uniref:Uncharacterized protein n=1 Tax=Basidiobolus meristosporus CBS 931.73 TaxID=1314790 RepID=A0A1Y1XUS2_9FUNG|nr:hypothetical protein K493DRAFT_410544 [Basidiobolus meristosporus CBS 931.73]|eukprot:ORX89236.1 hypothetical protein K493DRAFT_410544 [Basidiobolus meristosporus CBS 931.73]